MPNFIEQDRAKIDSWRKKQVDTQDRAQIKRCEAISEFLTVTLDSAQTASKFHEILNNMVRNSRFKLNREDREIYRQYMSDLEAVVREFEQSNFVTSIITDANDDPTTISSRLSTQVSSEGFNRYLEALTKLVLSESNIKKIYKQDQENWDLIYKHLNEEAGLSKALSIDAYFAHPYQTIPRFPILSQAVLKQLAPSMEEPGHRLVETTKAVSDLLNEKIRAQQVCQYDMPPDVLTTLRTGKPADKNIEFCKQILKQRFNHPTEGRLGAIAREREHFFDGF